MYLIIHNQKDGNIYNYYCGTYTNKMHMETISKMLVKDKIRYFKYIFLYSHTYFIRW